ncbi:MAG TPA: carbohydrate ABC transporter permease [Kineosporiaceae bacterium]|nr:carbohydrate ABC transporter permease [Kineosporiaceae bacterium]
MSRLAGAAGRTILLAGVVLFFGLPMLWLLLAPSRTAAELAAGPPLSFGSTGGYLDASRHLLDYSHGIMGRWFVNSVAYSVGSVVLGLATAVPAGYALATFRFPGRSVLLFLTLVLMIVPPAALILPLYLEMSALQLTNTPWAVILPLSFYPFGVYIVFLFTASTMPESIIEAARLDGCSEWGIFGRIFLPLARPALVMVGFFAFVASWNAFFLPYIMLSSQDLATMQTGLQLLVANTGAVTGVNFTGLPIKAPEVALAAIVSVLPILLIFAFAQRHLVAGQTAAAEKG